MDYLFTYIYPILWLISRLYFHIVNVAFNFVNSFIARSAVDPIPADEIGDLLKLAEMIRKGEITSSKVVQAYVNRIKQVNPQVNAVVTELFEEAIETAENVDRYLASLDRESDEYKQLSRNKPLLGIPCTIKDNLKVKGCVSLAGNKMFLHNEPNSEDAEVVKRLREAGAIPLATTNLPCFANGSEAHNVVTGRTRNPYDLRRSPGGSSGGESALIASAASLFGIGNDVGGSIRLPCYMCGIFGLKPSMDIVPVEGTILDPNSLTSARVNVNGPMCRYAEDLGLVLRALIGEEFATTSLNINRRIDPSNIKIFYMEELNNILAESMHPEPRAALRKAIGYWESKFGIYAHLIDLPMAHRVFELFCAIVVTDDRLTGKYLLDGLDMAPIRLEFDLLSTMILDGPEKIHDLQAKCEQLRQQIISLLADDGVLLFPALPSLAPYHRQTEFLQFNIVYTCLFNALRLPSLSCTLGVDSSSGLPVGIQVVGKPHSEALLITVAKQLENGFGGWVPPGQAKT